eukprot:7439525-Pyramimonas_sp.AAC.1
MEGARPHDATPDPPQGAVPRRRNISLHSEVSKASETSSFLCRSLREVGTWAGASEEQPELPQRFSGTHTQTVGRLR